VNSVLGEGSSFTIYLPQATESCAVLASDSAARPQPIRRETVLVVEDEPGVREVACEFLKAKGYSVLEACDGKEALSIIEHKPGEIDLVLSDMMMPKMGGIELVEQLASVAPNLKIVLMSGYYEYSNLNSRCIPAGVSLVQKPFSPKSLDAKVRAALTGITEPDTETLEVGS
jgi:two-component system cell cycle sensor histidine kinase/response regulator CckA